MLLTPWALHEHGALLPELVALPPLLLAALRWSVEPRRAVAFGVACGLLPLIKLPLVVAAVVLLALCARRRRSLVAAAATLLAGVLASAALGGEGLWREVVYAQTQSGHRSLSALAGFWAQGGWNLLGLLVAGAIAWGLRARSADPRLLGITAALGLGMLITFATNLKQGTSLNIVVPVEAVLVPLALAGVALAASEGARLGNRRLLGAVAGLALTFVQAGSLLHRPLTPCPFCGRAHVRRGP